MTKRESLWIAIAAISFNITVLIGATCHWERRYNENQHSLNVLNEQVQLQTALIGHYSRQ